MRARQRLRLHAFDTTARTRRTRVLLRLLVALLALQALVGVPAMAQGGFGCSQPPAPEYPGSGSIVGQLDPPTAGHGAFGSAYEDVAYAGLVWHAYGYSGQCYLSDPQAPTDTYLGSMLFNVGKTLTAVTNGLWYVVQDGGFLSTVDDFINVSTPAFYDAVFTPYLALALLIVAMIMLWRTMQGDMAEIGKRTFFVFAGLWLATTTYLTPLVYTQISDQILVHGASELQGNLLKNVGYDDLRNGLPTMLHEQTVVQPWQLGEFGGTNNPQAAQYSRPLWEAQACTKIEALDGNCNTQAKNDQYTNIATSLKNTPAYPYFTGAAHSRVGAGAMAALRAVCYDLFQLFCLAGLVLAEIVIRVVIVGGPVLGLLAILKNTVIPTVFRSIGNAVGQGLILTVAAAGHAFALGWVLRPASGMSTFAQLLVMALLTIVLWLAVRPAERLAQMTASTVGITMPTWAQRRQNRAMRSRRAGENARRGLGVLGRWLAVAESRAAGRVLGGASGSTSADSKAAEGPQQRPEGAAPNTSSSAPREPRDASTSGDRGGPAAAPRSESSNRAAGPSTDSPSGTPAGSSSARPRSESDSRTENSEAPTRRVNPVGGEHARASGTDRGRAPRAQDPPQERTSERTGGQNPPPQQQDEPRRRPRRVRPREDGIYPGAVEGQQRNTGQRPENTEPQPDEPLWSEQEE